MEHIGCEPKKKLNSTGTDSNMEANRRDRLLKVEQMNGIQRKNAIRTYCMNLGIEQNVFDDVEDVIDIANTSP